jgi:fatty-acyl-CoA synthase
VRTRDLAEQDARGYLRLLGRIRDVIIVHAELVHAGPVERTLATHPDVAEAYVIGRPDHDTGEAAHAFIVPVTGRRPDPDELRALVSGPGRPRTVTLIDRVPVAAGGKPDKEALRLFVPFS